MAFMLSTSFARQRINSLERQLKSRRMAITADKNRLITSVKQHLSEPKTLLAALSLGFIAGEITYRPRVNRTVEKAGSQIKSQGIKKTSSLENINQFITTSYRLFTSAPVIALMSAMRSSHHTQEL